MTLCTLNRKSVFWKWRTPIHTKVTLWFLVNFHEDIPIQTICIPARSLLAKFFTKLEAAHPRHHAIRKNKVRHRYSLRNVVQCCLATHRWSEFVTCFHEDLFHNHLINLVIIHTEDLNTSMHCSMKRFDLFSLQRLLTASNAILL